MLLDRVMFEVDLLPITIRQKSGDVITLRFRRRDAAETAGGIVDAGFVGIGDESPAGPEK